jgi:ribosome-binding protein aMBF1 (putative translation factor)
MQITTGNEIKAARLLRDIARQNLANRIGMPLDDLRVIENRKLPVSQEIAKDVQAVFDEFDAKHQEAAA